LTAIMDRRQALDRSRTRTAASNGVTNPEEMRNRSEDEDPALKFTGSCCFVSALERRTGRRFGKAAEPRHPHLV